MKRIKKLMKAKFKIKLSKMIKLKKLKYSKKHYKNRNLIKMNKSCRNKQMNKCKFK